MVFINNKIQISNVGDIKSKRITFENSNYTPKPLNRATRRNLGFLKDTYLEIHHIKS